VETPEKLPLSTVEKKSIYIVIFLTIAGYMISIFTCEDIFPRFGALIVCVGVYFGTSGYFLRSSGMDSIHNRDMDETEIKGLEILETKRGLVPDELLDQNKNDFIQKSKEIRYQGIREKYKLDIRILRVEGAIIIFGTLVWGFGDWFVINNFMSFCE